MTAGRAVRLSISGPRPWAARLVSRIDAMAVIG
jgi:hypothetical protein